MAIRPILVIPDEKLRKTAEPVSEITDEIRTQVADMFDTMYDAPGIGLAAPQIGVLNRVIVMDCGERSEAEEAEAEQMAEAAEEAPVEEKSQADLLLEQAEAKAKAEEHRDPIVMINPEIVSVSEETKTYEEGCLSIPEYYETVERPAECTIRFMNLEGETQERDCDGLLAVCVQHEIDHLNGKLFIDFLSRLKRERVMKKFQKAARRAG